MSFQLIDDLGRLVRDIELCYDGIWKAQITSVPKGNYFLRKYDDNDSAFWKILVTD